MLPFFLGRSQSDEDVPGLLVSPEISLAKQATKKRLQKHGHPDDGIVAQMIFVCLS
jgi:hypothetical protein